MKIWAIGSRLLGVWSVAVILIFVTSPFANAESVEPKYSIMQGATSDTVTYFTVVARRSESIRFQARSGSEVVEPKRLERHDYEGSDWSVHRISFEGLNSHDAYDLEVLNGTLLEDRRHFRTLDVTALSGQVALLSCALRQLHNPLMWDALAKAENRPDLLLFVGDAVYLDRDRNILKAQLPRNGLDVWNAYVNTRNTLKLYYWRNLVPLISTWDDHDAGGDDATAGNFPLMPEVRRIYDIFFANETIPGFLERGPGLASQFRLFGKNWIVLDGRSYRDLNTGSPLFGQNQENWLLEHINPGANFLANGVQFFGKYLKKDSLEYKYPEYSKQLVARLRQRGEQQEAQLAFLSGDIHFSEVQHLEPDLLGYPTYEITSSSVHSFGFPGHYKLKPANPRRINATGTHNAVILSFDGKATDFTFDIRSLGWRDVTLFQRTVTVGITQERTLP